MEKLIYLNFMYMNACLRVCIYLYCMHAMPEQAREGARSPETEVTDAFEPPCGYWELNSGLLGE